MCEHIRAIEQVTSSVETTSLCEVLSPLGGTPVEEVDLREAASAIGTSWSHFAAIVGVAQSVVADVRRQFPNSDDAMIAALEILTEWVRCKGGKLMVSELYDALFVARLPTPEHQLHRFMSPDAATGLRIVEETSNPDSGVQILGTVERELRSSDTDADEGDISTGATVVVAATTMIEESIEDRRTVCNADEVSSNELNCLADVIKSYWQQFASFLEPDLFTLGEITAIERQRPQNPWFQAKIMLDTWKSRLGVNAHRQSLIKALLDLRRRHEANQLFGQKIVDNVAKQQ